MQKSIGLLALVILPARLLFAGEPAVDYEDAMKWYRFKSMQGAEKRERVALLQSAIKKYKPLGVDITEAEKELATLEGGLPGAGTAASQSLWNKKRHGLGFALGTTAGTGFSYMYNFPTKPTLVWEIAGLPLRDLTSIGSQLQVAIAEGIRSRLLTHLGIGYFTSSTGSSITNFGVGLGIDTVSWDTISQLFSVEMVFRESISRPGTTTTSVGFNYTIHYHL